MEYNNMWSRNVPDSATFQTGHDEFAIRTEFNLKMIENVHKSSPKKPKRYRSAFTTEQINYLEEQFQKYPYIVSAQRKEVANVLNIPERAIKIWFQNRRMREKKETGREFDEELSFRKSMELATTDRLSNDTSSTNEQQPYTLRVLSDVNKVDCVKMYAVNESPRVLGPNIIIADSGLKASENEMIHNTTFPPFSAKSSHLDLASNYMKSAEFSIDLCKKYKNANSNGTNFMKPLSMNDDKAKQTVEPSPVNNKVVEQIMPEDLSSNRKTKALSASQPQLASIAARSVGFISPSPSVPPFYTQPFCSPSGNLWKPVNMMTAAPNSVASVVPVTVSSSAGSMEQTAIVNLSKKCVYCGCHAKPPVPSNIQNQSPNPQLFITNLQLPNTCPKS